MAKTTPTLSPGFPPPNLPGAWSDLRGMAVTLGWLAALGVAACVDGGTIPPGTGGGGGFGPNTGPGNTDAGPGPTPEGGAPDGATPAPCGALDVLFVVDNGEASQAVQVDLAAQLEDFLSVLEGLSPVPSYRIGVIATAYDQPGVAGLVSPGEEGALLQSAEMANPWLDRGSAGLLSILQNLVRVDTLGTDRQQPLRAARVALRERSGPAEPNAGFLRADAHLAIVLVAKEDDLSTQDGSSTAAAVPVTELAQHLDAIKGARSGWHATVIAGDQTPSCTTGLGTVQDSPRLRAFVQAAQPSASFASLCQDSLAAPLAQAAEALRQRCTQTAP